ncbi:protein of unknown function DUF202 [Aspergillus parasiticus SU-1]|uniref:DUF202 domain-containing protein n=1 Tax=Aspergillus parasiticus (strain ATCC 56775 / NRRL 5862 / SRRC 143 / SU-1) TaxID=1403190 RepID=A0A0F0IQQ1_ASPPU|nr:protein of unknown function DUF202 [Aspergillus parasiticus SU-1]
MFSLWRRILPKRVANTGSQLRDHQANERTFLSWTRMGLGFAAMALALGRLDAVDRMLSSSLSSSKLNLVVGSENATATVAATPAPVQSDDTSHNTSQDHPSSLLFFNHNGGFSATTFCQAISVWSFGYGIFRYLSVRKSLLKGQFTPAIWGPVLMTTGCLGVFGTMGMWVEQKNASRMAKQGS